jgi:hypothetical protein
MCGWEVAGKSDVSRMPKLDEKQYEEMIARF